MLDPLVLPVQIPCMPIERTYCKVFHHPLPWVRYDVQHDYEQRHLPSRAPQAVCASWTRKWRSRQILLAKCQPRKGFSGHRKCPRSREKTCRSMTWNGKWSKKSQGRQGWKQGGGSLKCCLRGLHARERYRNQWRLELYGAGWPGKQWSRELTPTLTAHSLKSIMLKDWL